jgi:hypothetical protein
LGILLVGIIATMQLFPSSLLQARKAAELNVTSETAASVLGEIQSMSAQALYHDQVPATLMQLDRAGSLYGFKTNVSRVSGETGVYLQRVTMAVTLADGSTETFTTYVAHK